MMYCLFVLLPAITMQTQIGTWEAKADEMVDPCYHSACDHADNNINYKLMHIITKAVAGVLDILAADKDIKV